MNPSILRSPNLAEGGPVHVVRIYEWQQPSRFRSGGLARAAEATRAAGRAGDDVLLHITPEEFDYLKSQWGEPSVNPHTGLPEYGFFSKIKRGLKFEKFRIGRIFKAIKKQPLRLFTGAFDPLGTKIANKVLGKDWKPLGNQLGAPSKEQYAEAEAKGIDTKDARMFNKYAQYIAGALGSYYGGAALGNALGGAGAATTAGTGASTAGTGAEALSEVVPTVSKIGADAAVGAGAGSGLTAASLEPVATTVAKIPTQSALAQLGTAATNYAKNPKNWGTIAKGATALGALTGGAGAQSGPPEQLPGAPLPDLDFAREQQTPDLDWYTYGERGPEADFYRDNTLPEMPPVKSASGGPLSRHVRGPGTGRSDSIPARLSDGEYVLTAEDVALIGDGSNEAGARRLDKWREQLRRHKGRALARGRISPNAKSPMAYLKGAR